MVVDICRKRMCLCPEASGEYMYKDNSVLNGCSMNGFIRNSAQLFFR